MGGVAGTGEEGEITGAGLLEAADATNLHLTIAEQLATEPPGQLAQLHWPALSPLFSKACVAAPGFSPAGGVTEPGLSAGLLVTG